MPAKALVALTRTDVMTVAAKPRLSNGLTIAEPRQLSLAEPRLPLEPRRPRREPMLRSKVQASGGNLPAVLLRHAGHMGAHVRPCAFPPAQAGQETASVH